MANQPTLVTAYFASSEEHTNAKKGHHHASNSPQKWPTLLATATTVLATQQNEGNVMLCNSRKANNHSANSKGGQCSPLDADTHLLDLSDLKDHAFDLVVNHEVDIKKAIEYTNNPIPYQGIYQRKQRYQRTVQLREKEEEATNCLANLFWFHTGEGRGEHYPLGYYLFSSGATKGSAHVRSSPPCDLGLRTCSSSPVPPSGFAAAAMAKDAAVESLPAWVDKERLKGTAAKKRRRIETVLNNE